jgi:hypothetical protein
MFRPSRVSQRPARIESYLFTVMVDLAGHLPMPSNGLIRESLWRRRISQLSEWVGRRGCVIERAATICRCCCRRRAGRWFVASVVGSPGSFMSRDSSR